MTNPHLKLDGLAKSYGRFTAVEGFSLDISEGEFIAIMGPSGCGKTTLMRMLTGFLAPSAGRAVIAGFDVREQRIEASKRLGYLPE